MSKKRFDNKGVALIMVLWVLTLLSVLVLEFCFAMRTEVNITRNYKEESQLYFYAQGGVQRAITELIYKNDPKIHNIRQTSKQEESSDIEKEWRSDGTPYPVSFQYGAAEVKVVSESGLININQVPDPILKKVIGYFVEVGEKRDTIVDSILDWRDPDDLHHMNGAENDYYQSLPEPYDAKNANFDSVDELLLVRGITPELFYGKKKEDQEDQEAPVIGLKDVFTVFSTAANVDINSAPAEVLMALFGIPYELAKKIVSAREADPFNRTNLIQRVPELAPFFAEVSNYIGYQPSTPYYKVSSWGKVKAGDSKRGVECVVKIEPKEENGYKIVMWKDIVY